MRCYQFGVGGDGSEAGLLWKLELSRRRKTDEFYEG